MAIGSKTLLGALALGFLLLLFSGCSHMRSADLGPQDTDELQATATAMAAQGGNGFVCDGGDRTSSCFCKKGAIGNFSCKGMDRICGKDKVSCQPDGWCSCGGLYPKGR